MITNDIFLQAKRQRIETNEENLCYICNIPYSVREYRQCKICLRFYHLSCYNSNDYCKYCLSCEEITNINEDNNNESIFNNSSHNKYSPIKKSNSKTLASNYNTLNEQLLWNVNHLYNNNNNIDNAPRSQYNSHRCIMSASSSKKTLLPSKSQDKALFLQNKIQC